MSTAKYPKYLQVDLDFYDIIDELVKSSNEFKVFYFDPSLVVLDAKGESIKLIKKTDGMYLMVESKPVRLDRVITINGKVGPAYEEYDAYANTCLSCLAGYEDPKNI